jgi:hypothetical protein
MRTPSLIWSVTTLSLGIACTYLASRLADERSHARLEASVRHDLEARLRQLERTRSIADRRIAISGPTAARPSHERRPGSPDEKDTSATGWNREQSSMDPKARALARANEARTRMAKTLQDPTARELLRAQSKAEARSRSPDLGRALHLTAELEDKLIELLADQQMRQEETFARHAAGDEGFSSSDGGVLQQEEQEELISLLGSERFQQYQQYQAGVPERQQVQALRSLLDESNALTEDEATRLIATMREERDRYTSELTQDRVSYVLGYPFTPMSLEGDAAAQLAFAEGQISRTEAFMARIHDRAAAVLTANQLRRFGELQEELLTRDRAYVQRMRERTVMGKGP